MVIRTSEIWQSKFQIQKQSLDGPKLFRSIQLDQHVPYPPERKRVSKLTTTVGIRIPDQSGNQMVQICANRQMAQYSQHYLITRPVLKCRSEYQTTIYQISMSLYSIWQSCTLERTGLLWELSCHEGLDQSDELV